MISLSPELTGIFTVIGLIVVGLVVFWGLLSFMIFLYHKYSDYSYGNRMAKAYKIFEKEANDYISLGWEVFEKRDRLIKFKKTSLNNPPKILYLYIDTNLDVRLMTLDEEQNVTEAKVG